MDPARHFSIALVACLLWWEDGALGRPTTTAGNTVVYGESFKGETELNTLHFSTSTEWPLLEHPEETDVELRKNSSLAWEEGEDQMSVLNHETQDTDLHVNENNQNTEEGENDFKFTTLKFESTDNVFDMHKRNIETASGLSSDMVESTEAPVQYNINPEPELGANAAAPLARPDDNGESQLSGPAGGYINIQPAPDFTPRQASGDTSGLSNNEDTGNVNVDGGPDGGSDHDIDGNQPQPEEEGGGDIPGVEHGTSGNNYNNLVHDQEVSALEETHENPLEPQGGSQTSGLDHPIDFGPGSASDLSHTESSPAGSGNSGQNINNSDGDGTDLSGDSDDTHTNNIDGNDPAHSDEVVPENGFNSSNAHGSGQITNDNNVPLIIDPDHHNSAVLPEDVGHKHNTDMDQNTTSSSYNHEGTEGSISYFTSLPSSIQPTRSLSHHMLLTQSDYISPSMSLVSSSASATPSVQEDSKTIKPQIHLHSSQSNIPIVTSVQFTETLVPVSATNTISAWPTDETMARNIVDSMTMIRHDTSSEYAPLIQPSTTETHPVPTATHSTEPTVEAETVETGEISVITTTSQTTLKDVAKESPGPGSAVDGVSSGETVSSQSSTMSSSISEVRPTAESQQSHISSGEQHQGHDTSTTPTTTTAETSVSTATATTTTTTERNSEFSTSSTSTSPLPASSSTYSLSTTESMKPVTAAVTTHVGLTEVITEVTETETRIRTETTSIEQTTNTESTGSTESVTSARSTDEATHPPAVNTDGDIPHVPVVVTLPATATSPDTTRRTTFTPSSSSTTTTPRTTPFPRTTSMRTDSSTTVRTKVVTTTSPDFVIPISPLTTIKIITFPGSTAIAQTTPLAPPGITDQPTSFVELKLGMSWPDFCAHERSIRGELVEILHVQGGHVEITADQIQVMNREEEECYQLNLSVSEEILVHMYLMNKSHHFDRGLTLVCAQILEAGVTFSETSIIGTKLIEVRFHDEYYIEPATGASTNKDQGEGESAPNPFSDPGVTIAIVLAVVGGCCCVALISIQIVVRRRNKENTFTPSFNRSFSFTSSDSIQLASVTKSRPNSGLFNPGLDLTDPLDPTHPLNFTQLANFSMDDKHITEEYQKLPNRMPRLSVVPTGDEDKNRYANVLPLAQTRVKLQKDIDDRRSSYINASYVTGPNNECQYYIATQAPTTETIADFWTMVWQQGSKAIVMLTQLEEDGQSKCATYWPELVGKSAAQKHGDFLIELKQKEVNQEYIVSKLVVNNLRKIETRQIDHFWYTCWPSQGMPEPISLVKLVLDTRPKYEGGGAPLIVHCSPGTGRTCTFIALDLCMRQFESRRMVDVMKTVHVMRQERAGAIQNKEQYVLLYHAINEYATIVVSPVVSAASSATTLHALLPS